MLIPIGFLGGGAAAGSYELIGSTVLGSASPSIDFTSIPQTYKHLQIRWTHRSAGSPDYSTITGRINNDTGSNYVLHRLTANGSSVTSSTYSVDTLWKMDYSTGSTAVANAFSAGVMDILDYASTNKNKTMRLQFGVPSDGFYRVSLQSGLWLSTSAITSIKFADNAANNFAIGTRFSLYGIKG